MKFYKVGGCVRDMLLGLNPSDIDYVVVDASELDMLNLGFERVGKDFPVFLHPENGCEYALARTEKSTGNSYTDFVVETTNVSLEDDLKRRDLTINSIAYDDDTCEFIDPFNGISDLKNKILRHTSIAFKEDPVRILRIARFAARYDFTIANETVELIHEMVSQGMLDNLVPERVFKELDKVLSLDNPSIFFETLLKLNALDKLFPELFALIGQTQPEKYHPEGDSFVHTMLVLQEACNFTDDKVIRFAALVHDLGKGLTKKEDLPKHHGHEQAGVPLVKGVCDRIRTPVEWKDVSVLTSREHLNIHKWFSLNPKTMVSVFERSDAFRKPEQFKKVLLASICDANGRGDTIPKVPFSKADKIMDLLFFVKSVDVSDLVEKKVSGETMKNQVHQRRISLCKNWLNDFKQEN